MSTATNESGCEGGAKDLQLEDVGGGGSLKKGPWTSAEDAILVEYVKKHGEGNWNAVQKHSGLFRCGKSCRLRWANHLRPNLKKGAFTSEEERIIIELHGKLGNKWTRMAAQAKKDKLENQLEVFLSKELDTKEGIQDSRRNTDQAKKDKLENQLEVFLSKELETKEGIQDSRRNTDQGTSLREDVQLLCHATNLLGKQMIFLEEDAEAMIKEYQFWMKEHETYRVKLEEEQRATQEMLQVESSPLVNLEEEILQQHRKINCLKGQILQNEEMIMRILKMVTYGISS